ncbi:DUF6153 family protein [Streptomyces sp. NPDC102467]|uniref:DUF6153 family protein n=1 Tax=Streptomyces sp. NPDC102467 TaxID=3366179 RepID=UPI00380DB34F
MATTKGRTGRGQLLLFVALLFGIVGMHTLGHPTGHVAGGMRPMASHAAPVPEHTSVRAQAPEHRSPGDSGMDPLSVCLAVLGSFTLLLLTAAVLRPLGSADPPGPAARGLTDAHRPRPPPPRTLLSRLSVLRI